MRGLVARGDLEGEREDAAVGRAAMDAWDGVARTYPMEHVRHWRGGRALARLEEMGDRLFHCWDAPSERPVLRIPAGVVASRISEQVSDFGLRGVSLDGRWMLEAGRGQDRTVVVLWAVPEEPAP